MAPSPRRTTLACLITLAATAAVFSDTAAAANKRANAAAETARSARECTALGDFYWEIGDKNGVQASGQIGSEYSASTEMKIASASKWVWGAYVLEKIGRNARPSDDQVAMLEMRSGYTAFNPVRCLLSRSVGACMEARGNDDKEKAKVGRFSYGGGHSQRLAVSMGLGKMSAEQLTAEVKGRLGAELGFSYDKPQLAGGMRSSASDYAQFLRKIMKGQLRMHDYLGYDPVCTLPGVCKSAVSSPVKEAWHYSLNHWVEDAPGTGDGSFSSPGLMGFYPWISADKQTYGILARQKLSASAYWDSVQCGREIRKAWMQSGR
ncbi:hypothetical protein E4T66_01760 [Sinimarinibacterium sp. CAU 1509]|uniref:hypothetical protein n=1 Tax=Sinimarinibacterium sp. CAU 1509 TaxID=2562283 RepID=UPI0010ACA0A4|nr:hypothetical protein [Sinimarinibacterium sp. CAU 1509]TJY64974.1 hypothetical protein E4T66_01760 [Sinimarinibacterium sp. CAU 1509]